jgi:uroporphyrinogen decarboxylase
VSLQPVQLVGSEAVILFSDIFTPIPAMGVEVDFQPGPIVGDPIGSLAQVEKLRVPDPQESTPFVFEILRVLRSKLASAHVPLLGFAGAPFTLAAYLVEGKGSKDFGVLKRMMYAAPEVLRALQARLVEMVVGYLNAQIEAGAQVVQLFDTWAGLLGPAYSTRCSNPVQMCSRWIGGSRSPKPRAAWAIARASRATSTPARSTRAAKRSSRAFGGSPKPPGPRAVTF